MAGRLIAANDKGILFLTSDYPDRSIEGTSVAAESIAPTGRIPTGDMLVRDRPRDDLRWVSLRSSQPYLPSASRLVTGLVTNGPGQSGTPADGTSPWARVVSVNGV
jgi:hypothetical protein